MAAKVSRSFRQTGISPPRSFPRLHEVLRGRVQVATLKLVFPSLGPGRRIFPFPDYARRFRPPPRAPVGGAMFPSRPTGEELAVRTPFAGSPARHRISAGHDMRFGRVRRMPRVAVDSPRQGRRRRHWVQEAWRPGRPSPTGRRPAIPARHPPEQPTRVDVRERSGFLLRLRKGHVVTSTGQLRPLLGSTHAFGR